MANNENLTPFKKGTINNPKGRPKGVRNRATIVKEMLALAGLKKHQDKMKAVFGKEVPKDLTVVDQMTAVMVAKALSGDVSAYRELMDSGFGKLTDKVDNMHSFTKMGRVEAQLIDEKKEETVDLTFDVGDTPLHEAKEEG